MPDQQRRLERLEARPYTRSILVVWLDDGQPLTADEWEAQRATARVVIVVRYETAPATQPAT